MARDSKIEWTHHTFNPWWGCTKVSAACKHCYAETWAKRLGRDIWGAKAPRRFFTDHHWKEPLRWNLEAKQERRHRRVFCASMADVFEKRKELDPWREHLWALIEATPNLDWLLLTKRPHFVSDFAPWSAWPSNVWLGTTVETQRWAEKRIEKLTENGAVVRFLSCEPLLGPLDLRPWLSELDWIISGGESGPKARPMNPSWLRDLRDQCLDAQVAFHFKQWGNWFPIDDTRAPNARKVVMHGVDNEAYTMVNIGKKKAGRKLDGRFWNQVPKPKANAHI